MALTNRQTLFGIVITFLGLLILFEFLPPVTLTSSQTFIGIVGIVTGSFLLAICALMKRGKLKTGWWSAGSATETLWQGIGFLFFGLGNLSILVVESSLAMKLKLIGVLVCIVAILVGRKMAKAVAEV